MMPEYRIRRTGHIVETGLLPQSRQYGSTSTCSSINESTDNSDARSLFYKFASVVNVTGSSVVVNIITISFLFLIKHSCLFMSHHGSWQMQSELFSYQ